MCALLALATAAFPSTVVKDIACLPVDPDAVDATFVYDAKVVEVDGPPDARWWVHPKDNYAAYAAPRSARSVRASGYRGIWFALGQVSEFGDKYSGGLGTYTSNHQPMAAYAPEVHKTFFTYGGAPSADRRQLMIMVSYYDHARGVVPRPVALFTDPSVDDPHDNASLQIDSRGHIWIFKSGRGIHRPGMIYRSVRPHDIDEFEQVGLQEFTYPQIWRGPDEQGFFLLFTKYVEGDFGRAERRLFWKTSADGRTWSGDHALAGFGGHYQTSGRWSGNGVTKFATFFNYHPKADVDRRTNFYYAQTTDGGKTWTSADGRPLSLPLTGRDNPALALDLETEGKLMYSCDLAFDTRGNPILLGIVSRSGAPGPEGSPREWTVLRWTGAEWIRSVVAVSTHNYDMGSLYVDGAEWRILGPTGEAPQKWGTGGEMECWVSRDAGTTWAKERALTARSESNHSYARRPHNAHPDFAAFWADGNPDKMTPSRIYFSNADGSRVGRLPYDMPAGAEFAKPEEITLKR